MVSYLIRAACFAISGSILVGGCLTAHPGGSGPSSAPAATSRPVPFPDRKFVAEPGWLPHASFSYYAPYWAARWKLPRSQLEVLSKVREQGIDPVIDITDGKDRPRAVFLDVYRSQGIRDRNVWRVNLLPQLEYLDLYYSNVSAEGISSLDSNSLRSMCYPRDFVSRIVKGPEWGELEPVLPRLCHVDIPVDSSNAEAGRVLSWAGHFRTVESLHLLGMGVTDAWVEGFLSWAKPEGYGRFRGIGLRGTSVTGKGLGMLGMLPRMTHLAIVDANMKVEHLQALKSFEKVEELHLSMDQLRDGDLMVLQALPKLRVLVLDHSPITDEGMKQITKLDGLEFLSVVDTKISPGAAAEWRKARPGRAVRLSRGHGVETIQGWMQGLDGVWDDYHGYRKYPWVFPITLPDQ